MATSATQAGRPARADIPRPSRRDNASRLPSKSSPSLSTPKSGLPSSARAITQFGFRSTSSSKSGNVSDENNVGNRYAPMNVVQPVPNIPVSAPSLASTPTPQSQVSYDSLEPSPGAETPPPPSLVSGSSISSHDSPRSNVLRRKPSVIAQYMSERQNTQKESGSAQPMSRRIEIPRARTEHSTPVNGSDSSEADRRIEHTSYQLRQEPVELIHGADGVTLPRRTPLSEASTTPSLTYSTSPSQFSHTTTATSLTSQSPMTSSSPFFGMRPFTLSSKKMSPRPSEPLGHPFFRQTNQSGTVGGTKVPTAASPNPQASLEGAHPIEQPRQHIPTVSPQKTAPVHPPELAHLSAASSSRTNLTAPTRPSRNGTPNLHDQRKAQPVVHSNLPKLNTSYHHRRESGTSSANEPLSATRSSALRQNSQSAFAVSPEKIRMAPSGSQVSLKSMGESVLTDDSTASFQTAGGTPKSKSRFGFFSRKPKTEDQSINDAPKSARKGPAAGTGHEGYAKQPARLRSGSSSSHGSSAPGRGVLSRRKSSGASSKTSDLDDFLQQRLSPVYLRGEAKDNQSQASESTLDEHAVFTPSHSSPETAHTSTSSADFPNPIFAPQAPLELELPSDESITRGRPSIDQALQSPPTSRSPSRKRLVKPRPNPKEPMPKKADMAKRGVDKDNADLPRPSTQLTRVATQESLLDASVKSKKSNWSPFHKDHSPSKSQGNGSFFQRSKPSSSPEIQQAEPGSRDSLSGPTLASAHYLPIEASTGVDVENLDNIMREAQVQLENGSDAGTDFEDLDDEVDFTSEVTQAQAATLLSASSTNRLDTAPAQSGQMPQIATQDADLESTAPGNVPKPSRLVPVGRIPSVSSKKDQLRKPTNLSFSRPFARASPRPELQSPPASATSSLFPPSIYHAQKSSASSDASAHTAATKSSTSNADAASSNINTSMRDITTSRPFLEHEPRKNSDVSYSSSSGTMYFPTAATIAHAPGRHSRTSADEAWPEYDDLIDHVLTRTPSASSRQSKHPFDSAVVGTLAQLSNPPSALPRLGKVEVFPTSTEASDRHLSQSPVIVGASEPVGAIAAALRETPSICTLRSTRSNSMSNSLHSRDSAPSFLKHKRSSSLPLDARLSKTSEDGKKDTSQRGSSVQVVPENPFMFRYRVLMTSKWLSFGRLLFSPIHEELSNPSDRVLVIDGLGNRDWSYYCAVSYPQTQIYSLGPSASSPADGSSTIGDVGNLSNYRHFAYTTPGTDFPFPKGFFAAVVYRFPAAGSDAVMRAMVSECKRVLRPGGYLEISTIDLDLSNMGSLSRRAIRNLKTQMRNAVPNVSLNSASDSLQSLIGRRGFENLKSCVVGVPAAGVIGSSRENSHDGEQVDFGSLANDNSKEGDDHITKMVSQVGRWWYTQCYESAVLPNGDTTKSLWCDRELLHECEELNTTFKLLICHAQKPSCAKRRTVSL